MQGQICQKWGLNRPLFSPVSKTQGATETINFNERCSEAAVKRICGY